MTDQSVPEAPPNAGLIDPPPLDSPPPPAPPQQVAPPAGTARTPSRKRSIVAVVVILGLLGVILFVVKDNTAANDLKVGDCFDVPTAATIKTVVHHPCTEAHTAEVFHVAEFTGSDMKTPLTFVIENFVGTACAPVFTTYVGKDVDSVPDLAIGYFYPSNESWSKGSRTITCYVTKADESAMTKSLKGSAAQ